MPFTVAGHLLLATNGPAPAGHAFVANMNDNSLTSIDISDPANMAFVAELTDGTNLAGALQVEIDRAAKIAIVAGTNVAFVNIANPASMSVLGAYSNATYAGNPHSLAIDAANSRAWVLENTSSPYLTCISYSNPASPSRVGSVTAAASYSGGKALVVDVENEVAYCLCYVSGGFYPVQIVSVDISTPSAPVVLDTLDLVGNTDMPGGMCLSPNGQTLFATHHNSGYLSVINTSDPANMSITQTYTGFSDIVGGKSITYLPGDILLVSSATSDSLKTFNVTNTASITLIDTEIGATYLDGAFGHARDPYNGNAYVVAPNGSEITSYAIDGSGNFTFIDNYASATQLNGSTAVALL